MNSTRFERAPDTFSSCPTYFRINIRSVAHVPTLFHEFEMTREESPKIAWVDMFQLLPDTFSQLSNLLWVKEFILISFDVFNVHLSRHFLTNSRWLEKNHQKFTATWCLNDLPTLLSNLLFLSTYNPFFECPSPCIWKYFVQVTFFEFVVTHEERPKMTRVDMFQRPPTLKIPTLSVIEK